MKIIQSFSVNNDCYKNNANKADSRYTTFQQRGPKGLMLHSVGCNQSRAKVFADGWNRSGKVVAVHAVLQADGAVYQCLPWNYRGWHAGGDANNTHIGVEMTEPDCIQYTGGDKFTCSDQAAAQAQVRGTYNTAVALFAFLCKQYGLDPLADGVIISHKEGCKRGIASNHSDPEHLWTQLGMGYTMDTFRAAVKAAMGETAAKPATVKKGDMVKISGGAVYDGKKQVPDWVIAKAWIVKDCVGDRAVIDKSTDGKNAICSPICVKFLTVVDGTATPAPNFSAYCVRITTGALNIRRGPGTNYGTNGCIRDRGVYTIVEEASGAGAAMWGKLKSGAGWISLDYTKKV